MEYSQPCLSLNLDDAKNSTATIPLDLIYDILSKLPSRSIIRFQTVSKLWFSIIRSKDFVNSFLARSKTRPRLLFNFKDLYTRKLFIFSSPEHDMENDKVVARHDITISDLVYYIKSRPVNSFVCFTRGDSVAVCNPTTRQIVKLPDVKSNGRHVHVRLGYDPVQDEYKVLCVMMFVGRNANREDREQEHFVFTLRSQQQEWKKIVDVSGDSYINVGGGICIDGAIYFGADHSRIARFDVRNEKIEFIQTQTEEAINVYRWSLINHKGKLGGIEYYNYGYYEMRTWMEEREGYWNSVVCDVPSKWADLLCRDMSVTFAGEIHTGEAMLVSHRLESTKSFSVLYYDPIKESFRRGDVEGIADGEFRRVHGIGKRLRGMYGFPGYIENITFL